MPWSDELIASLMRRAYYMAWTYSDDIHTKNGALIVDHEGDVLSWGANRFPGKIRVSSDRQDRSIKSRYMLHAEESSIINSANVGISTSNMILVCPWAACTRCARQIIGAGISKVLCHEECHNRTPERWIDEINQSIEMFNEAGITYERWSGKVGDVEAMMDCTVWEP